MEKLAFSWDEVHDIAEELEHIESSELVNRLDDFLDNPKFDPHGDPIPDRDGVIHRRDQLPLAELTPGDKAVVTGVKDSSSSFLQFLDNQNIQLGHELTVTSIFDYDKSRVVEMRGKSITLSQQVCKNLYVKTA